MEKQHRKTFGVETHSSKEILDGVKVYRPWDPVASKAIVSRDVFFNEPGLLKERENVEANKGKSLLTDIVVREFDHSITNDMSHEKTPIHMKHILENQELQDQAIVDEPITTIPDKRDQTETFTKRSQRSSRAFERFGAWANSSILKDRDLDFEDENGMALILKEDEPSSYRETQASVNKLEWNVAMEREIQSLIDNKTWKLIELPKYQIVIDSKWVYKLKDNPTGDEARIFKARLLARGFTHEKDVDYNKIFSPIAKYATICMVCALAATFSLVMDQMDVITTLLYGYLEEEIYMRQPIGFDVNAKRRGSVDY
ncbi:hypothetical protein AXG93_4520s1070 [Marchantia polymorpha subsp. ruderalis]|uniref:Reverse transcriptase Ty1/copia-type domain-containing protein n=1 Tax=Marchantia polymorpha subsp. ruderalis TaxID=1480154 RepID=A0A176VS36_MARPO|nr:hypothetical protein AXG93_4520s1070 [Marchantia polymorpha subsp. ruderalis]